MSLLPGQPGSSNPSGDDWQPRKIREQAQTIEQLRGQLSQAVLALNAARAALTSTSVVKNVTVSASTLTVTYGDGSTHNYQLA